MRASLKNYMAACNRRKEETGESGFSLIELIVVVVILGILAAIAVPVFTGLQGQAEESALKTIAANGATQAASNIAQGEAVTANFATLQAGAEGVTLSNTGGDEIDSFCISAAKTGVTTATSGPGCAAPTAP